MVIKKLHISFAVFFMSIVSVVSAQEIFKEEKGLFATSEIKISKPIENKNNLLIKSNPEITGKINIVASPTDKVTVKFIKKVKTESRSRAYDYIDLVTVNLKKSYEGILLTLRAPNPAPWNLETESVIINLTITVPDSCAVDIEAFYFDVDASGPFSKMIIPKSLGRLNVYDVNGMVDLSTSNRKLTLEKIVGEISASTRNSKLEAIDIVCEKNQATFKNDGGEITIENFTGQFNIKNSYARTDIENFNGKNGKSFIRSFSGPVLIDINEMTGGQLIILNRYDDIELMVPSHIEADFSLAVEENGKIESSNLIISPNLIETNRLNFVTGQGNVKITGSIRGDGNILLIGKNEDY
ncbi:MAG: hypothetical protein U9N54_08370 [candidate division Zixibacteria bacterium]|nr:hypothetical protein [candidate division Zixibacteria bacterium]